MSAITLWLLFLLSFCLSVFLSFCLSFFLSFCLSVFLSFCLSVFLSFCLSVLLSFCPSVLLSFFERSGLPLEQIFDDRGRCCRLLLRVGRLNENLCPLHFFAPALHSGWPRNPPPPSRASCSGWSCSCCVCYCCFNFS